MDRRIVQPMLATFLKGAAFLLLFLSVYYVFFLRPETRLARRLAAAETELSSVRNALLDNRLSLVGLARLDPDTETFAIAQTDLLDRLARSNEAGLAGIEGKAAPSAISGGRGGTALAFYDDHLLPARADLLARTAEFYRTQKPAIERLKETDRILLEPIAYHPEADFKKDVATAEERERFTNFTEDAIVDLDAFSKDAASLPEADRKPIVSAVTATKKSLEALLGQVRSGRQDLSAAEKDVLKKFTVLRTAAIKAESAFLRQPDTVELLTQETNLLLEYDFWLENVERHLTSLYRSNG
jgi:hypothetical protein